VESYLGDGLKPEEAKRKAELKLIRELATLDQPESLPPPLRTSRDITILAGGCALIRPSAWNHP
jgi:hypothetical protein